MGLTLAWSSQVAAEMEAGHPDHRGHVFEPFHPRQFFEEVSEALDELATGVPTELSGLADGGGDLCGDLRDRTQERLGLCGHLARGDVALNALGKLQQAHVGADPILPLRTLAPIFL